MSTDKRRRKSADAPTTLDESEIISERRVFLQSLLAKTGVIVGAVGAVAAGAAVAPRHAKAQQGDPVGGGSDTDPNDPAGGGSDADQGDPYGGGSDVDGTGAASDPPGGGSDADQGDPYGGGSDTDPNDPAGGGSDFD